MVFITGASAGIGKALALESARRGANLILCARRMDRLAEVRNEASRLGARIIVFQGNVTESLEVNAAVEMGMREFGRVDIAIANAGIGITAPFLELSNDDYRKQFNTNIYGVLRTVRAALPAILATKGQIAIMGSVSSYVSTGGDSPYAMSKAAIRAFADSLFLELRPKGVGVTLVCPGFVASEIRVIDNKGKLHQDAKDPIPSWLVMDTNLAARKMLDAIERRDREVIITSHGKIAVWLRRFFPSLVFFALKWMPSRRVSERGN